MKNKWMGPITIYWSDIVWKRLQYLKNKKGIYIYTIETPKGEFVRYVGKATSKDKKRGKSGYEVRFDEHINNYKKGEYRLFNFEKMKNEGIDKPLNYGKLNLFYNMNLRKVQRDIFSDKIIDLLENDYEWGIKERKRILDELNKNSF